MKLLAPLKRVIVYAISHVMFLFFLLLAIIIRKHSNSKRIITITILYTELTSKEFNNYVFKKDLDRDSEILYEINQSMGLSSREGIIKATEFPLIIQRLLTNVLGKNLFFKRTKQVDDIIYDNNTTLVEKESEFIYESIPSFLRYGRREEIISDVKNLLFQLRFHNSRLS